MLEGGLRRFPFKVSNGHVLSKAFNLVGFPYNEVFDSLLRGVEFQQYGIEWFFDAMMFILGVFS